MDSEGENMKHVSGIQDLNKEDIDISRQNEEKCVINETTAKEKRKHYWTLTANCFMNENMKS